MMTCREYEKHTPFFGLDSTCIFFITYMLHVCMFVGEATCQKQHSVSHGHREGGNEGCIWCSTSFCEAGELEEDCAPCTSQDAPAGSVLKLVKLTQTKPVHVHREQCKLLVVKMWTDQMMNVCVIFISK